ncbi:MAG: DMT family transporter [Anaerolineae bacterium]|nr:DMT family transporter [Anaerolineae bacterium]
MFLHLGLLLLSVLATSTAVIMIKASAVQPVLLAALRLLVAAVALTPIFIRDYRRHPYMTGHLRASLLPGLILGIHFISWIVGARMTPTANASLIVNLVPVVMPFFLAVLLQERLTRNEFLATGLALCGVVFLTAADFNLSATYFVGDMICFISMLFYAFYMALGRKNRHFATIWLYLVPLYYFAGILCFVISLFFVNPLQPYSTQDVVLILGLGIVPTVIGHSLLNYAMKHLRGQQVSIINMGQFVFAGLMAYALFGEVPDWTFYPASLLLLVSAWITARDTGRQT